MLKQCILLIALIQKPRLPCSLFVTQSTCSWVATNANSRDDDKVSSAH